VYFANELLKYQPISEDASVTKNSMRYRGIEGFIAAVSPFNFTAIGGNLAYTPALMVIRLIITIINFKKMVLCRAMEWSGSHLTQHFCQTTLFTKFAVKLVFLQVLSTLFLPTDQFSATRSPLLPISLELTSLDLSRKYSLQKMFCVNISIIFHSTFNRLWAQVGKNINSYKSFPRLIGECGGKNYHFIHPSADPESVVMGTIRSAFEYCGQKCSACSRMYVPESLWPKVCHFY